MSLQRAALVAIAIVLVLAEVVRPTRWATKRISHATAVAIDGAPLDTTILDSIPPIAQLALGSIDVMQYMRGTTTTTLTSRVILPKDARLVLTGWAGDPQAKSAPSGAFISVDGHERIDISSFFTISRPDVVKYFDAPGLLRSGFRATIATSLIGEGTHELQFGVIARGGRGFYPLAGPIDVTVE